MSTESWTIEHFSLSNPEGPGQEDLPRLLRRLADHLEAMGPVEVQDLVLHSLMTADGPWWSFTVYFQRPGHSGPTLVYSSDR